VQKCFIGQPRPATFLHAIEALIGRSHNHHPKIEDRTSGCRKTCPELECIISIVHLDLNSPGCIHIARTPPSNSDRERQAGSIRRLYLSPHNRVDLAIHEAYPERYIRASSCAPRDMHSLSILSIHPHETLPEHPLFPCSPSGKPCRWRDVVNSR
jgi:hypothetical protein